MATASDSSSETKDGNQNVRNPDLPTANTSVQSSERDQDPKHQLTGSNNLKEDEWFLICDAQM